MKTTVLEQVSHYGLEQGYPVSSADESSSKKGRSTGVETKSSRKLFKQYNSYVPHVKLFFWAGLVFFPPHFVPRNVHLIQWANASQTEGFAQGAPKSIKKSQKTNTIDTFLDYQFYLMLSNLKIFL